jgi:hypothetical protein
MACIAKGLAINITESSQPQMGPANACECFVEFVLLVLVPSAHPNILDPAQSLERLSPASSALLTIHDGPKLRFHSSHCQLVSMLLPIPPSARIYG